MFNMNLLFLLLSSPPKLLEKNLFILEGICTLCSQYLWKVVQFTVELFIIRGNVSVGNDFFWKEKPLEFYIHQKLLSLPSVFLEDFCFLLSYSIFRDCDCCSRPGWALADRIFSACAVPLFSALIAIYVWPLALNWLSCNCSVRVSNKWIVYLLGYIEQCGGGGSDDIITDIISWKAN